MLNATKGVASMYIYIRTKSYKFTRLAVRINI
jgi:hypothetical protein